MPERRGQAAGMNGREYLTMEAAQNRIRELEAENERMEKAIRHEIEIAKKNVEEHSNPVDKHYRWFFEAQLERLSDALDGVK
jgi:hypothetical protein